MDKYRCKVCMYIYDPEIGDPDNFIEPGTAFDKIPTGGSAPSAAPAKRCSNSCNPRNGHNDKQGSGPPLPFSFACRGRSMRLPGGW